MFFGVWTTFVFLLDRGTKYWVVKKLHVGETFPVIKGFFHFTHVRNSGAAFGLFPDQGWFLIIMTLFVLALLLYWQYTVGKNELYLSLVLGLLFSGALGNLVDRLQSGAVIDFLDFRGLWPYVFNLADVALVSGLFLLAGQVFWGKQNYF